LGSLFLEILLVDGKLLRNLRAWLSGKQVLEFNVKFLFLLDDYVFFNDFFGFLDQALLQGLNLLEHFPGIWVSAFKFAPSVVVKWVLKFFRQGLY